MFLFELPELLKLLRPLLALVAAEALTRLLGIALVQSSICSGQCINNVVAAFDVLIEDSPSWCQPLGGRFYCGGFGRG
jgi:hypothetical protein